jgi:hypothetical protein
MPANHNFIVTGSILNSWILPALVSGVADSLNLNVNKIAENKLQGAPNAKGCTTW